MAFRPTPIDPSNPLGKYIGAYLARSTDKKIRTEGGGAVTAILLYLLDKKKIDGVVTAKKTRGIKGEVVLAKTRSEILRAAGNRWSIVPYTMKLKETLLSAEIKRIAFVGLPCQAQFLRQMKMFPLMESDFANKIYIIISLFCMGTFAVESFADYLARWYNIPLEEVENIDIEGDYLVILYSDKKLRLPIDSIIYHIQHGCILCPDYTGIFADISAGRASREGYTLILTRSRLADNIVNNAAHNGYLEISEAAEEEIRYVRERALDKLNRSVKYITRIL